jgi:hypothetical protein
VIVPNKTLRENIERFIRSMRERVAEQQPPQPPQQPPQPPQPARASVDAVAAAPPKPQPQPPQLYAQPPSVSVSAPLGSTPAAADANRAPQSTAPEPADRMPMGAPPVAARSIAVKPVAGGIERADALRSEPVPAGRRTGDRAPRPAGRGGVGGGLPWPPMQQTGAAFHANHDSSVRVRLCAERKALKRPAADGDGTVSTEAGADGTHSSGGGKRRRADSEVSEANKAALAAVAAVGRCYSGFRSARRSLGTRPESAQPV